MFYAIPNINSSNNSFYKSTIINIIEKKSNLDSIASINEAINEAIRVVNEEKNIYSVSNESYHFTMELVRKLSHKLKGHALLNIKDVESDLYNDIIAVID